MIHHSLKSISVRPAISTNKSLPAIHLIVTVKGLPPSDDTSLTDDHGSTSDSLLGKSLLLVSFPHLPGEGSPSQTLATDMSSIPVQVSPAVSPLALSPSKGREGSCQTPQGENWPSSSRLSSYESHGMSPTPFPDPASHHDPLEPIFVQFFSLQR